MIMLKHYYVISQQKGERLFTTRFMFIHELNKTNNGQGLVTPIHIVQKYYFTLIMCARLYKQQHRS